MIGLGECVVAFVASELRASDFHGGTHLFEHWQYRYSAEEKINRMTNVELLNTLEQALQWRRDGGDIGL